PVGAAIDRGHGRTILACGSALAALMLAAWSRVADLGQFYAIFAGIGVAQAMTLYEPAFAVAARRAIGDPRSAITALTLWGGFASTVFVPLTQRLMDLLGWRGALLGLAALNVAICIPLHIIVVEKASSAPIRTVSPLDHSARPRAAVRRALRDPVF